MNIATRLELNLKAAVGAAMADLIAADLRALWIALEPMLIKLPDAEQLRIGGMAISELAEICQLKAERMLADWEEEQNETGPAMTEDLLAGLVQRTMYLEISDLTRQPQPRQRSKSQNSRVEIIAKADLLALLTDQASADHYPSDTETSHAEALAVAHQENLSVWVGAVADWMRAATFDRTYDAVPLTELQRLLNMPLIELWLALLLGGYELKSRGGFYETEQIWITVA